LLITVDTLRADALGSYGKPDAGTPWMDRLAAAGVRFADAHAHNVLTLPSHASILSGLYPQEHGVRDNSGFRFPPGPPTLAGLLKDAGYRTGAFVSAFPLGSRFGLDRGFEVYDDRFVDATSRPAFLEQERAGTETVELAKRWLAKADGRPSFCWVHLYEPHFPYAPPLPSADPYQGEVAAADTALAPLLEPILAAAEDGGTLVVLTSDHGEALGEHGEATHGIFAYEATLKVPWILYQPRLLTPRVVTAPARHVDILPTILDALALPVPAGVRGRSLLAVAAGGAAGETGDAATATYFEALSGQLNRGWAPLYGVIHEGTKYVDLPIPELYDLDEDPREEHDLAAAEPRRLAELRELLAPLREIDPGMAPSPESAEVRRRLESLGYLSGGGAATKETYTEDDDPKRLIALDAMLREVAGLHAAGDLDGAVARAREVVRRRPGMKVALVDLAQLERARGEFDAAVAALRQALTVDSEDPVILALLGASLTQAGRPDEAAAVTEPHSRLAEPDVDVLLVRGLALARLGRPRDALAVFEKAGRIDPANPEVPVHVGTVYLMGGLREQAREAFRQALALHPDVAAAHVSLAVLASEDGRPDEALDHWRAAIAADPGEVEKLFAVGSRLWAAGRTAEARPLLELFIASAPPETYREEIARARGFILGRTASPSFSYWEGDSGS
jgi:arylsulfatase A-like enzyme/cytochrome c-type biogenesis protein CcmH/NrfG